MRSASSSSKYQPDCCFGCFEERIAGRLSMKMSIFRALMSSAINPCAIQSPYSSPK